MASLLQAWSMRCTWFLFIGLLFTSCSTSDFFFNPSQELREVKNTDKWEKTEVFFPAKDGRKLNGWWIRPKQVTARATVLFLHGNADNVSYQYETLIPLVENGFEAFIFDYEGYGKSQGKPSQENVYDDALSACDYLEATRKVHSRLLLFGQSLGGHLAVVLCAKTQEHYHFDGLVIEGAFASHKEIARDVGKEAYKLPGFIVNWIVPSRYEAIREIPAIKIPKLIIHSRDDRTVDFKHGEELYKAAVEPKIFWEIKGPHVMAYHYYRGEFVERICKLLNLPSL